MGKPKVKGEKSFAIPKSLISQGWERVFANRGAAGVDSVGVFEFRSEVQNNLYKLWNRMSAGSYFPEPVRAVEIPKAQGAGVRVLGVPTVADRVAQTAACIALESKLEPIFHPDSYGYRPKRSAHQALAMCRRRCWDKDWVIDLDIRAFFDSVRHDLLLRAVSRYTDEAWLMLYLRRWLTAPMQMPDGTLVPREKGTPQGSPISPLLANLFMHHAFDLWIVRQYPDCPFERYADDVIVHCDTEEQARQVLEAIGERMRQVGLELHPDKTRIVYCKDGRRRGNAEHTSFDFLSYRFQTRRAKGRYGIFWRFMPAMSPKAIKAVGHKIRAWHLRRRSGSDLADLAEAINPQVRGWISYYGAFYRSKLYILAQRIDDHLVAWAMHKYKRLRGHPRRARAWLDTVRQRQPNLFAHWQLATSPQPRPVGAV